MTIIVLFLFVWLPACFIAGTVADNKGFSGDKWAFAAFFFGPLGLLGAVGLPDKKQQRMLGMIAMTQGISREAVRACGKDPDDWADYLRAQNLEPEEDNKQSINEPESNDYVKSFDSIIHG